MEKSNSIQLTIGSIIGNGVKIGLKNAMSLIAATILWLLTFWIPYLNVGTTIGLLSIVVAMSRGGVISPLGIFDGQYRRYMGEFFLLMGLRQIGVLMGFVFLVFPGIVIALSWSQALYLLVDKKLNPVEALKTSNDITYGHKWTMFFGMFFLGLIFQLIVVSIAVLLAGGMNNAVLAMGIMIVLVLLFIPIIFGAMAHIYGTLSRKLDE